jgi:hypothetical protein
MASPHTRHPRAAFAALPAGAILCLVATFAWIAPPRCRGEEPPLELRLVDESEWGDAVPQNVRAVLLSAGRTLLRHVPDAVPPPVEVSAKGGPILLYERSPEGALQVRLDTGGKLWSQYSFQFAHEICHAVCRERPGPNRSGHLWFEEALCETASLFVLRRMAESWRRDPPYPNWAAYAPRLAEYADARLAESPRPEGMPLAAWYERHREELESQPLDRANALAVAAGLLPLFEARPERWAAVRWLNVAPPARGRSFSRHLQAWRLETPSRHAPAVDAVAAAFGITLDSPAKPPPLPAGISVPAAAPAR